jgi:uncharacterized spore protein YtfJ
MEQEKPSRKPRGANQSAEDTLATEAATDQPTPSELRGAPGAPVEEHPSAAPRRGPDVVDRLIEQLRSSGVDAVFGETRHIGRHTLIPVASITYGLGFGFGRGRGRDRPAEPSEGSGEGEGEGGGGMVRVRPLAVVVIDGDTVRVRPVVDVNRLVFAAVVLFGLSAVLRAMRRR